MIPLQNKKRWDVFKTARKQPPKEEAAVVITNCPYCGKRSEHHILAENVL